MYTDSNTVALIKRLRLLPRLPVLRHNVFVHRKSK
jgi:hypothetical protein